VVAPENKVTPTSRYETDRLLSEYAEFHYGSEYFGVANFSKALVDFARPYFPTQRQKALDIGCASGRASFELARDFESVTGIDFSVRFIGHGVLLAQQETLRYVLTEEGDLVEYKSCHLADLGLAQFANRVAFFQGDACNLKPQFSQYDFVMAANLIDRLYNPTQFLTSIHERLSPGGVLLIASPYTWLEEHTPKAEWLGGFKKDGESWRTRDALDTILTPHFERLAEPREIPFVIRETRRKFQHTLSEVTIWRKK
jgi:putative 4-mercaptohistidine N1-methyltranferase